MALVRKLGVAVCRSIVLKLVHDLVPLVNRSSSMFLRAYLVDGHHGGGTHPEAEHAVVEEGGGDAHTTKKRGRTKATGEPEAIPKPVAGSPCNQVNEFADEERLDELADTEGELRVQIVACEDAAE